MRVVRRRWGAPPAREGRRQYGAKRQGVGDLRERASLGKGEVGWRRGVGGGGHVFRAERRPSPVLFAVRVSYRAHTPAQRERREPFPGLSLFVKTKLPARSGKHWECGTIQPSPPRVPLLNAPVCGRRRPRNGKHLTDHRNTRYLELSAAASPLRVVLGGPCGRLPGRERERVVESGRFFCSWWALWAAAGKREREREWWRVVASFVSMVSTSARWSTLHRCSGIGCALGGTNTPSFHLQTTTHTHTQQAHTALEHNYSVNTAAVDQRASPGGCGVSWEQSTGCEVFFFYR